MARPAKFSEAIILGAASELVAGSGMGSATITAISHATGASNGSIYHRFRSRDELLGRLWLQKATYFQDAFVAALDCPDPLQAAQEAALSLPRSARADFKGARVMLLHRREDFLSHNWPPELQAEAKRLGQQVVIALTDITRRLFGEANEAARLSTTFAVLDIPFAAVRRYVGLNKMPPPQIDDLIVAAVDAILSDQCHFTKS